MTKEEASAIIWWKDCEASDRNSGKPWERKQVYAVRIQVSEHWPAGNGLAAGAADQAEGIFCQGYSEAVAVVLSTACIPMDKGADIAFSESFI